MDGWMRYSFLQRDEWHKLKRELEVMHLLLSKLREDEERRSRYMVGYPVSVRLSVCHKPVFRQNG